MSSVHIQDKDQNLKIYSKSCGYSVKISGPISLPSWSIFDQAKALIFHYFCFSFLLFYNSQQFMNFQVDCYGYIFDLGALACHFFHRKLVHATQINITHLIHCLTADNEQI
jgi:hypothetical protein